MHAMMKIYAEVAAIFGGINLVKILIEDVIGIMIKEDDISGMDARTDSLKI